MRFNAPHTKSVAELGQAIKKRRLLLDITQEDLSQIGGVSLRSLKALEKGEANPTWSQITKIIQVLGWKLELKEVQQ